MKGTIFYDLGEIFKTHEDIIDWKDFCYHVAKDHTHRLMSIKLLNKIDAFRAWRWHRSERYEHKKLVRVKTGFLFCPHCKLMGTERTFKEYNCMSVMDTDKNKEKKEPKLKLQVYSGGKDGEGDWLMGLPKGSVFTCLPTKDPSDYMLAQFHVMNKWGRCSVYLMSNFPMHQQGEFLVHSTKFSQLHTLVDILQEGEADHGSGGQGEEVGDGNGIDKGLGET